MNKPTPYKRCNARCRNGGKCRKPPVKGRNRCRLHGGATPAAGPTHHLWKHGEKSKYFIGSALAEHVKRVSQDKDLMTLNNEIVLANGLISEWASKLWKGPISNEEQKEFIALADSKLRLIIAEYRRRVEIGALYRPEYVRALADAILAAVKKTINDPRKVAEIGNQFMRIMGATLDSNGNLCYEKPIQAGPFPIEDEEGGAGENQLNRDD